MVDGEETVDDGGVFGRPVTLLPDGGRLHRELWRAIQYPRTMESVTVLKGGALVLASVLAVPIPLLLGYALAVVQAVSEDRPAPTFENWQRLYVRGLGLAVIGGLVLFLPTFALAFVLALAGGGEPSDAAIWLLFLTWYYATPWSVGVYGQGSWRSFFDRTAWRWLASPNYLLTAITVTVALVVGYLLYGLSVITLVGPLFVAFLLAAVLAALLGGRYGQYRTRFDGTNGRPIPSAGALSEALGRLRELFPSSQSPNPTPAGADATTETTSTAADDIGTAETADTDKEYTHFRERARHVESDGLVTHLEAGDGGRIRFLSLESDDEELTAAFEGAVDRWESISHNPAVTTVYDTGEEPTPWAAYDPLSGSLRELGGTLSPGGVVAVTEAVEDALTTGRRYNIAHGAARPDCVFIERAGGAAPATERIDATLGEWEIQRELAAITEEMALPARYCAPEQFGDGPTDSRVDVYQLGAIAHYALFGEAPFSDADPAALRRPDRDVTWTAPEGYHVTDETIAVFERALATAPDERHETTGAFQLALRRALPLDT